MIDQDVMEKTADVILEFVGGTGKITLKEVIEKVTDLLSGSSAVLNPAEEKKIESFILEYRKGKELLEDTINKIYKEINPLITIDTSLPTAEGDLGFSSGGLTLASNSILPNGPLHQNLNTSSSQAFKSLWVRFSLEQERVFQKQYVENREELKHILEAIIDPYFLDSVEFGYTGSGAWYQAEITLPSAQGPGSTVQHLFTYHETNINRFFSPNEIVMGFFHTVYQYMDVVSKHMTYLPAEGRITKR